MRDQPEAFKIDASLPVIENPEEEQLRLDGILSDVFAGRLVMEGMDYDPSTIVIKDLINTGEAENSQSSVPSGDPENEVDGLPIDGQSKASLPWQLPAYCMASPLLSPVSTMLSVQEPDTQDADAPAQATRGQFSVSAKLDFEHPTLGSSVITKVLDASRHFEDIFVSESRISIASDDENKTAQDRGNSWTITFQVTEQEHARRLLDYIKDTMGATPYFASSSGVGGQVAGETRDMALVAMVISLIGIVAYVWIRFQNLAFGLAAIVALVHDVLVVLGAIAVSHWLAAPFGFLLIEDFRISLAVIAALLTIIGYSLNDTIVVFDRIREVRGKRTEITADIVNQSISQTLSRTILTSLTTFIVVVILYAMGGEAIHAFAFSLVIGVAVGTYSSIFVASPALLWLMNRGIAPMAPPAKK